MFKSKFKNLLMTYILTFVDLSNEKLVAIFDKTFQRLKLKNI